MTLEEILNKCPSDEVIVTSFIKANSKINNPIYDKILCSVSGGADSDIIVDICTKLDNDKKITYVWFDTGLEYQATKEHLKYLEEKYNIKIEREKAAKPIPIACKQYGVPFVSKQVSDRICRLQKHHFKWENKPFDELYKEYPKCKCALQWWCNTVTQRLGVGNNKYPKEFLITNPPNDISISDMCCTYAKKNMLQKNN